MLLIWQELSEVVAAQDSGVAITNNKNSFLQITTFTLLFVLVLFFLPDTSK